MNVFSNLLQNIPGYDLLTVVIGRDPVSGQEVKGDGITYLAVLVGLIPGGLQNFLDKIGTYLQSGLAG